LRCRNEYFSSKTNAALLQSRSESDSKLGFPQFVITQKISSWAMKGSASSIDKTVRQDPVGRKRATSAPD
jgi:hypothetical protein